VVAYEIRSKWLWHGGFRLTSPAARGARGDLSLVKERLRNVNRVGYAKASFDEDGEYNFVNETRAA